jgi:arsenite methyltransferase
MSVTDPWAAWLLERRHGGDDARLRAMLDGLSKLRDSVLDNARIDEGDVVLDLGCGDGLIGFGALQRVGATGRVIFSDISQQLLDVCREIAADDPRCSFLLASADELPLGDASVDVVTTRSVLIYLTDKRRAFEEAHRVLRPGGRLSIFEPINSYAFPEPDDRFAYYDVGAVRELSAKVKAHYRRVAPDDTLTDFDERDLVAWSEAAGFAEVHLELRIDLAPMEPVDNWEARENSSGNPLAPTLREAIEASLTPDEAERFRRHLRAEAEAGRGVERGAVAYLWARKAGAITA